MRRRQLPLLLRRNPKSRRRRRPKLSPSASFWRARSDRGRHRRSENPLRWARMAVSNQWANDPSVDAATEIGIGGIEVGIEIADAIEAATVVGRHPRFLLLNHEPMNRAESLAVSRPLK